MAARGEPGGVRPEGLARARPGDLGGARRAAALRLLEAHVLGRARPRREAREIRGSRTSRAVGRGADEIRADILEHGVRDGVLRQHYDTDALDASTLLAAIVGFLPRDDARLPRASGRSPTTSRRTASSCATASTRPTTASRRGGHLPDLLLLARRRAGDRRRARRGARSDGQAARRRLAARLYAEELETTTHRHLGNVPQAFSHLALIDAAMRIIRAEADDLE